MSRKKTAVFLICLLCLTLTGCWNRREMNELAIASAIGLDRKDNKYVITVQIINSGAETRKGGWGGGGSGAPPFTTYQATGDTVFETLRKLTSQTPRKIYLSHIRIVVLSEALAKHGVTESLDLMARDHEFRSDFYLMIAKENKVEDVLNVISDIENIPAIKMFSALRASEKVWGSTKTVTINDFLSGIESSTKGNVMVGVVMKNHKSVGRSSATTPSEQLQYDGLAVFKKDKLVGWMNEEESIGYNFTQGDIKSTIINVPCKQNKLAIEVSRTQTQMKVKVKKGKPQAQIHLFIEGNIGEVNCSIDISKNEAINKLQMEVEKKVKQMIERSLKKSQHKLHSDIFGIGRALYRSAPKEWEQLKATWDDDFPNVPVEITVDARLRAAGALSKSFMQSSK
ncbi:MULTISPECIES: Ger(x)C family spore germination protein [unclassified Paenibacillus]|uniref:Ger(x)C family spore germination protein n=1 Tax=unclassified Paenibacillus TaxID=185978 RepID=UPI003643DF6E